MLSVGWEEQCGRRGLPLWDSSASQFIGSCEDFLEAERCKKLFKIRHLLDMFGQLYKGAGTFHSAGQSKEGNLVLALPTIRFSWNFYQIISDAKYEYETSFGLITCHSWIMAKNGLFFHRILTHFFFTFFIDCGYIYVPKGTFVSAGSYGWYVQVANLGASYWHFLAVTVMMVWALL